MISWLLGIVSLILFLGYQSHGIYTGDSGDLVTAAVTHGVAHPPGYPLFTLLGWLLSHLPIASPSWRVALLSSIPHAIVLMIVYLFVVRLTKDRIAGIFAALLLLGNYVFFLYSVTPEVFGMYDLFVVLLILFTERFITTHKIHYLYAVAFTGALSLSHQQVILFFFPAIVVAIWPALRQLPKAKRTRSNATLFGLAIVGLLPYLYIPIAARTDAMVNWDVAVNWSGFWHLISRADYGTFVSNQAFGQTIMQRLLAIRAYASFLWLDVGSAGVLLAAVGLVALWKRQRRLFSLFGTGLVFLGPVFFFYASFPLSGRFTLATYERFLLPSYMMVAILAGIGISILFRTIRDFVAQRTDGVSVSIVMAMFALILFIVPASFTGMTLWRFWGLSSDYTADHLGEDLLSSVSQGGILLLYQDTTLFSTQYVRYSLGVRSDVVLLHGSRMATPEYVELIGRRFPAVHVPSRDAGFMTRFVEANAPIPVYSNIELPLEASWRWVPNGLLFRAVKADGLPPVDAMLAENTELFSRYHDPKTGILSRYTHLMLADVLDVYANAHLSLGKVLARAGKWEDANIEFASAVSYQGDTSIADAYMFRGFSEFVLSRCDDAIASFNKALEFPFADKMSILMSQSVTYRDCLKDTTRAKTIFDQYDTLRRQKEQPLEQL
jgi:hypothetical protein